MGVFVVSVITMLQEFTKVIKDFVSGNKMLCTISYIVIFNYDITFVIVYGVILASVIWLTSTI